LVVTNWLENDDPFQAYPATGSIQGQWVIHLHRVPEKKQATLIFTITLPSVEIFFLQFLKHFVQEEFTHDRV